MSEKPKLRLFPGNAKLDKKIHRFDLPAGHTCPAALLCRAFANRIDGHITDGNKMQFRCYAASQEAAFGSVRKSRHNNWDLIRAAKTKEKMVALLLEAVTEKMEVVRIHSSGDFFNQAYFDAWLEVIRQRPDTLFYAYTKALDFWVNRLDEIPDNFSLVASFGGRHDALIKKHSLKYVVVVGHPSEARKLKLEIDHDDSHAYTVGKDSFALLVHGTQPKGSIASASIKRMKNENIEYSYGRNSE